MRTAMVLCTFALTACSGADDSSSNKNTTSDKSTQSDPDEPKANPYYYVDADGDGVGAGEGAQRFAPEDVPQGWVATKGDCDDANADVYPAAPELCDGIDNDCDSVTEPVGPDCHSAVKLYPGINSICYEDGAGNLNCAKDDMQAFRIPGITSAKKVWVDRDSVCGWVDEAILCLDFDGASPHVALDLAAEPLLAAGVEDFDLRYDREDGLDEELWAALLSTGEVVGSAERFGWDATTMLDGSAITGLAFVAKGLCITDAVGTIECTPDLVPLGDSPEYHPYGVGSFIGDAFVVTDDGLSQSGGGSYDVATGYDMTVYPGTHGASDGARTSVFVCESWNNSLAVCSYGETYEVACARSDTGQVRCFDEPSSGDDSLIEITGNVDQIASGPGICALVDGAVSCVGGGDPKSLLAPTDVSDTSETTNFLGSGETGGDCDNLDDAPLLPNGAEQTISEALVACATDCITAFDEGACLLDCEAYGVGGACASCILKAASCVAHSEAGCLADYTDCSGQN